VNGFFLNISDIFFLVGKECDSPKDTIITALTAGSAFGNDITKLSLDVLKPGGKLLARVSMLLILEIFE